MELQREPTTPGENLVEYLREPQAACPPIWTLEEVAVTKLRSAEPSNSLQQISLDKAQTPGMQEYWPRIG